MVKLVLPHVLKMVKYLNKDMLTHKLVYQRAISYPIFSKRITYNSGISEGDINNLGDGESGLIQSINFTIWVIR